MIATLFNMALKIANSPAAEQWERVGIKHHHGIAISLSSIHSEQSSGIGEFTDLPLLIEWCMSVNFDLIQLLPLNDTGTNLSPYNAISAFALNPIFIGLTHLPHIQEHAVLLNELKNLSVCADSPLVDYFHVQESKDRFLRHYFKLVKPVLLKSAPFKDFLKCSKYWLKGYAAFKILKQRHQNRSWETWPDPERNPTADFIEHIISEEKEEFEYIAILQFLCDQQLHQARADASRKQFLLMGDLPILIARDSADVWLHPELFDLKYSAGAPPDPLAEMGQNWGFPIYSWEEMKAQNYRWWIERLRVATRYYHVIRIDHVVGFFRIWSIPFGKESKDGFFIPQDESTWEEHGERILRIMLQECDMLPIGEDLGTIPPQVRTCLHRLGICGTRVMRWERKWHEGGDFIFPFNYPLDSMCTVSTHDTELLQQWWTNQRQEAERFAKEKGWTYHPKLSLEHHKEILWDCHHASSLFHINLLQEYFPLIPGLSWPDIKDERINIPGVVNDSNWRYRLRPSLEELHQQEGLKQLMRDCL